MSKEELERIADRIQIQMIGEQNIGYRNEYSTSLTDRIDLYNEVRRLQERIDKAIKYIESNPNVFYDEYLIDVETLKNNECNYDFIGEIRFISKLLEILKGEKE